MLKAFKYRLIPDNEQVFKLAQAFGCARFLYNNLLSWWINEYETAHKEMRYMEHLPLVSFFKKDNSFLKDVDSLVLMNARRNFEHAIKNFLSSKKGQRKDKKVGFPTFKKKGIKDTCQTNNVNNAIRIDYEKGCIKLPKLKWVKCILHREIPAEGKIVACTMTKGKDNKYHVSVLVDLPERKVSPKTNDNLKVIGIDMSLSQFAVDSDDNVSNDTKAKYIRQYRLNEHKLAKLQRKLSRKQKGSKNREKARQRLASYHSYISNCRKDFCHKESLHYARDYDVVVIEDLNMQAMSQTLHLGKSVNDLGWGLFREYLTYKCKDYNTELVIADKWFASSKTCNVCGEKNDMLQLSDREWICPHCGSVIDRDINAARNLRDYYNKIRYNTVGTAEINACGEETPTSKSFFDASCSLKQEAPSFMKG